MYRLFFSVCFNFSRGFPLCHPERVASARFERSKNNAESKRVAEGSMPKEWLLFLDKLLAKPQKIWYNKSAKFF